MRVLQAMNMKFKALNVLLAGSAALLVCLPLWKTVGSLLGGGARSEWASRSPASDLGDSSDALTYLQLKADIRLNHIRSSEELLDFFGKSPRYRDLVSYPVLEPRSKALHNEYVTPAFPRIVMGLGNLALHLIGNPAEQSHQLVEIMEYLPESGLFRPHLINFALSDTDIAFVDDPDKMVYFGPGSVREAYAKTVGSIQTCRGCHGNNPVLPIWNTKGRLLRAFGNSQDRIAKDSDDYPNFQKFLATLNDSQAGKLYQKLRIQYTITETGDIEFPGRPNRRFTDHIFSLAEARLAHDVASDPSYPRLQYMIAAALLNCPGTETYLPAHYRLAHEYYLQGEKSDLGGQALLDALASAFQKTNTSILQFEQLTVPASLRAEFDAANAAFESSEYAARIAKFRYSVGGLGQFRTGSLEGALPDVAIAELDDRGSPVRSLMLDGASEGVTRIFSEHLATRFLRENPDLNDFAAMPADSSNLRISLASYCQKLSQKSADYYGSR